MPKFPLRCLGSKEWERLFLGAVNIGNRGRKGRPETGEATFQLVHSIFLVILNLLFVIHAASRRLQLSFTMTHRMLCNSLFLFPSHLPKLQALNKCDEQKRL